MAIMRLKTGKIFLNDMGNDPFLFFSLQTNRENLRIMSIFPELIVNSSTFNFFSGQ